MKLKNYILWYSLALPTSLFADSTAVEYGLSNIQNCEVGFVVFDPHSISVQNNALYHKGFTIHLQNAKSVNSNTTNTAWHCEAQSIATAHALPVINSNTEASQLKSNNKLLRKPKSLLSNRVSVLHYKCKRFKKSIAYKESNLAFVKNTNTHIFNRRYAGGGNIPFDYHSLYFYFFTFAPSTSNPIPQKKYHSDKDNFLLASLGERYTTIALTKLQFQTLEIAGTTSTDIKSSRTRPPPIADRQLITSLLTQKIK